MQIHPYQKEEQISDGRQNPESPLSLLVADCGTIYTKVSFLGLVEGQYRLLARAEAPTTIAPPYEDITKGIVQALREIESTTGRRFITDTQIISPEQPNGDGVDAFIATTSIGGPMRLAILGAVSAQVEELAIQAVSGLYAEVYALPAPSYQIAISSVPVSVGASVMASQSPAIQEIEWTPERIAIEQEHQVERIQNLQPHVILIVGMADGPAGAKPLQEACQLLVNSTKVPSGKYPADAVGTGMTMQSTSSAMHTPAVVYAGAPQYVEAVRHALDSVADVTSLEPLVSQAQVGPLSIAASTLYEREIMHHIPGYDRLRSWSSTPPLATATSLSSLVRFLAQHYAMNVTAVDVGGSTTTLMLAGEQGSFFPLVNLGVGVGPSIGGILQQSGIEQITRWLPFSISEDELRQYVLNRMLHPHVIPMNVRDLQISQAFTREAMILTVGAARQHNSSWFDADLIIATGGILAHTPVLGQVALMLLDALQPRGVTSLVLDQMMLIPQLGAVATTAPVTAVQVNENDAVTHRLGTCVIPFGTMLPDQVALRVGIEYSSGRQITVDIMSGSIEVVPLRSNEQALLTLFPGPTVDVGLGPGERARAAEEIDGGLVGLIIDARGRPLLLPTDEMERQARLLQWMQSLGA